MTEERRYGVEQLATLGGVTRRTVRFYVQEGLLPPPLGLGRGDHYTQDHLERLILVRELQERGLTIAQIRSELKRPSASAAPDASWLKVPRESWSRVHLMPGVELNVSGEIRLPPPSKLIELAEWCRRNLQSTEEETE